MQSYDVHLALFLNCMFRLSMKLSIYIVKLMVLLSEVQQSCPGSTVPNL